MPAAAPGAALRIAESASYTPVDTSVTVCMAGAIASPYVTASSVAVAAFSACAPASVSLALARSPICSCVSVMMPRYSASTFCACVRFAVVRLRAFA